MLFLLCVFLVFLMLISRRHTSKFVQGAQLMLLQMKVVKVCAINDHVLVLVHDQ